MRDLKKYRYVFAAVLTVLIFTTGMLFSDFMDNKRSSELSSEMNRNIATLESQQLQLNYLESSNVDSCNTMEAGMTSMIRDYNDRLERVQQYERNSIFNSGDFETIKNRYILSGIRYWIFVEELRENCNYRPNTVLFFTQDLDSEDCDDCESQGRQLDLIKQKYRDDVLIFSIPTESDDGMIDVLEEQYNVTEPPVIVINSEEVLEGYHSRDSIETEFNFTGEEQ